jgi:hypothetical protein
MAEWHYPRDPPRRSVQLAPPIVDTAPVDHLIGYHSQDIPIPYYTADHLSTGAPLPQDPFTQSDVSISAATAEDPAAALAPSSEARDCILCAASPRQVRASLVCCLSGGSINRNPNGRCGSIVGTRLPAETVRSGFASAARCGTASLAHAAIMSGTAGEYPQSCGGASSVSTALHCGLDCTAHWTALLTRLHC